MFFGFMFVCSLSSVRANATVWAYNQATGHRPRCFGGRTVPRVGHIALSMQGPLLSHLNIQK